MRSDVATGAHLTLAGFRKLVKGLRAQFSDRKLLNETFIVATPADPSNKTGSIAATHVLSALQDGMPVIVTVVAVLRIEWVLEHGHHDGGRRLIETEAFITNTADA